MNTLKISVVITAGGVSKRFGSNKLLELTDNNLTVIEKTILQFIPFCEEIVIPTSENVITVIQNSSFYESNKHKFVFAKPGETRQESVFNALLACNKPDYVLIHDGARPYVDENTIKGAIEKVIEDKAVCVGNFAVDTIKITDEQGDKIIKTIDRKTVFCAKTPQAFEYQTILDIHRKLKGKDFTDDASMAEYLGITVYIFEGNIQNKKITFKEDI